jgi:hypothetical protein
MPSYHTASIRQGDPRLSQSQLSRLTGLTRRQIRTLMEYTPRHDSATAAELVRAMVPCLAGQMTRWQGRKISNFRHCPIAKTCVDLDNRDPQDAKGSRPLQDRDPLVVRVEPQGFSTTGGLAETPGTNRSHQ